MQQPGPGCCTFFLKYSHIAAGFQQVALMRIRLTVVITLHVIGSYFLLPSDIRSSVMGQYRTDTDAVDQIGTSLIDSDRMG